MVCFPEFEALEGLSSLSSRSIRQLKERFGGFARSVYLYVTKILTAIILSIYISSA